MRYLITILGLMVAIGVSAETIYRSVDQQGNLVFSDTPTEGAEELQIQDVQTISLPPVPLNSGNRTDTGAVATAYKNVSITSPQNDAAIRENSGNLNVSVSVNPQLFAPDTLTLYLDGQEVSSGETTSFDLKNLERGTHQLRVAVKNPAGKIVISSPTLSFHLLRASVAQPAKITPSRNPTTK